MLSANNGPDAATFSEFVDEVSELRADAESDGVQQELNISIALPRGATRVALRELLHCMLTPDPKVRCSIETAALFAENMLVALKLDSNRIFDAQLSKKQKNKYFCASQHDTANSAENKGKASGGSLPSHSAVPVGAVMAPELRGLVAQTKIRDADAFLVPLIRKGLTNGTVESLESALTTDGNVSGALALRAALPLSLKAWDKYRPDLVIRSVIEIAAVRLDGDFSPVIALAQREDLIEAARKEARKKTGLVVQFRIVSTPLDLLLI